MGQGLPLASILTIVNCSFYNSYILRIIPFTSKVNKREQSVVLITIYAFIVFFDYLYGICHAAGFFPKSRIDAFQHPLSG